MLTVTLGVTGSGKTTWIRHNVPDAHLVTLDTIRTDNATPAAAATAARQAATAHATAGNDVATDACNLTPQHRRWWLNLARTTGHPTHLVIIHPPPPTELAARQRTRGPHAAPPHVVARQLAQWPTALANAQREPWTTTTHVQPTLLTSEPW